MKYFNEKSNKGIVNLFADFLVKEINKTNQYDVVIEVTDCGKFFVVNGLTNTDKILDMIQVKDNFYKEYQTLLDQFNYTNLNIIDLIMYEQELIKKFDYVFDFHNSSRPIYHIGLINDLIDNPQPKSNSVSYNNNRLEYELDFSEDDTSNLSYYTYSPLNISSEFPHGYSLSMGRQELYYSEYICNQLFDVILTDKITFKYSSVKSDEDGDFQIDITSNSIHPKKDIISMVLDVFDFDMLVFNDKIKDYNIIEDLTIPFDKKPWLTKDKTKDLILF
jgi:hypothetical protein